MYYKQVWTEKKNSVLKSEPESLSAQVPAAQAKTLNLYFKKTVVASNNILYPSLHVK